MDSLETPAGEGTPGSKVVRRDWRFIFLNAYVPLNVLLLGGIILKDRDLVVHNRFYPVGIRRAQQTFTVPPGLIQLPNPNISKAIRLALIPVRLQLDGSTRIRLIKRLADVPRLAFQLEMILHQHAIEQHRDISRSI